MAIQRNFADGASVSWASETLVCTCPVGRAHRKAYEFSFCKHAALVFAGGEDHIARPLAPDTAIETWVPIASIDTCKSHGLSTPVALSCIIENVDPDGLEREVLVDFPMSEGLMREPISVGYIHMGASRRDVRELFWPYLLERALRFQCPNCGRHVEFSSLEDPKIQLNVVLAAWAMFRNGYCVHCVGDADLIPDVDTTFRRTP